MGLLEEGKPRTSSDAHTPQRTLEAGVSLTSSLKISHDHVCPPELRGEKGAGGIPRDALTRLRLLSCYTLRGKQSTPACWSTGLISAISATA